MRLTILLSLFLLGCKTDFPTILPQERCFVVLETQQEQLYTGHCRCHLYEWTSSHIGRITESANHELNYCDKLGGFNPDSTGAIFIWQENIRLWMNRNSKKK